MSKTSLHDSASDAVRRGQFILATAFVFSFVYNLLRLTGPLFMLLIYSRVLPSRSEETLVALFLLVTTFILLMGLIDYSRRRLLARFGAQFQERVEERLFTVTSRNEFFVRARAKPTAGLDELDGLRAFFHSGALISILDFVWMPMFAAMVFVLHPMLGWLCLGGNLLLLIIILVQISTSGDKEASAKDSASEISELKDHMVSSRDVIRTQEMGAAIKQRWLAARKTSRDRAIALKDWTGWFDMACKQTRMLLQYSVLGVGAYYTLHGELTVGAMVAAMLLVSRVFSTVEGFMRDLPSIWRAINKWQDLKRILLAKDAEVSDPYTEVAGEPRARLALSNISVRSPLTGQLILRSLNMKVTAGKLVEVIGSAKAGKTVLAETILGIWKPSSGAIIYAGSNIARLSEIETSGIFGYLPETVTFMSGTIEENISHFAVEPDRAKVIEAAEKAGVHKMIVSLPDGYLTKIDQVGTGFSSSERSGLGLARAVYGNPSILVIDEPHQSLRSAFLKELQPLLSGFKSRGAVVIIFSRERLSLPFTNAQLLLERGCFKQVKVPDNVTRLENAKKPIAGIVKREMPVAE